MERQKIPRDILDHLPEVHRMVAEQYIRDGRWELIDSFQNSRTGQKRPSRKEG